MRRRLFTLRNGGALLALLAAGPAGLAGDGRFEITQADLPLTITNPGSYLVTENLTWSNGELVAPGSVWKYLDNGSDQIGIGTPYYATNYDDSGWASGPAELGYGDNGVEATTNSFGPNPSSKYVTTYFRHAFTVSNKALYGNMDLRVRRDDGVVVYLNGNEVVRDNMPGGSGYTTLSSSNVVEGSVSGDPEATYYEFYVSGTNLFNGTNLLAAEVHQSALNSSDMSFDLGLNGYASGSGDFTNAITIAADNVTLDLGGHVLTGNQLVSLDGVHVNDGVRGAVIRNGSLARWGNSGVNALGATNCVLQDLRAIDNMRDGLVAGYAALVIDCSVLRSGRTAQYFERGDGIALENGSVALNCVSYNNYDHGFLVASSCDLQDCVTARNSHDGYHSGQSETLSRVVVGPSPRAADGRPGEGIEVQLGTVVGHSIAYGCDDGIKTRTGGFIDGRVVIHHCVSLSNGLDGIKGEDGAVMLYNVAYDNANHGISMSTNTLAMYNTVSRNGARTVGGTVYEGLRVKNAGQHFAAFNHATFNDAGIAATPVGAVQSLIVGNSASRNTVSNYNVRAGNLFPSPTTNANTAGAWANFRF